MDLNWETIYGQVISKANNYVVVPDKAKGSRLIKSDEVREYECNFLVQCITYRNKQIKHPFKLHIHIYEQSNVYDLDNGIKTILDCLQYAGAITNDNLCVCIEAHKHIDRSTPRIRYAIQEYEPTLAFQ